MDDPREERAPVAVAKGCDVYVGNVLMKQFDERSDDYAYTNAVEWAKGWNARHAAAEVGDD